MLKIKLCGLFFLTYNYNDLVMRKSHSNITLETLKTMSWGPMMEVHTLNSSTWRQRQAIFEFKASLVYRAVTQRNRVLNQNKPKPKPKPNYVLGLQRQNWKEPGHSP